MSSKHKEITFPHEFIFVFILHLLGDIVKKNVKEGGRLKLYKKRRW